MVESVDRFSKNLLLSYQKKTQLTQFQIKTLSVIWQRYYTLITDESPSAFQQHYVPKTLSVKKILEGMARGEITSREQTIIDDRQKFNKKVTVPYQLFPVLDKLRVKLPYSTKEQNRLYFDLIQSSLMPFFGFFKNDLLRYFKNNRPDLDFNKLKSALSTEVEDIIQTNIPKKFYNYLYPVLVNTYDDKKHLKLAHWVYYCLQSINEFSKSKLDAKENRHLLNKVTNSNRFWTLSQIKMVLKKFNPKMSDHQIKIGLDACDKFNLIEKMNDSVLDKKNNTYRVLSSKEIFKDRCLHIWDEDKSKFYGKCFTVQFDKKTWMPSSPETLIYQLLGSDLDRASLTSYKTIRRYWGLSYNSISKNLPKHCKVVKTFSVIGTIKTDYVRINQMCQNNKRLRPGKSKNGYNQLYQIEANRHHSKIAYHVSSQTFKPKLNQIMKKRENGYIPKNILKAFENSLSPQHDKIQPSYLGKGEKLTKGYFQHVPLVLKQESFFKVKSHNFTAKNTKRFLPLELNRDDIFNNLHLTSEATEIEVFHKGPKREVRQIVQKKSVPTTKQILKQKAKESLKPTSTPHTPMIYPSKSTQTVYGKVEVKVLSSSLAISQKGGLPNRSDHC